MNYRFAILTVMVGMLSLMFTSCKQNPNNPGLEFAPNMYKSIPYEPLTQVEENTINPLGMNVRIPVKGTVPRRTFNTTYTDKAGEVYELGNMYYNTSPDDLVWAQENLHNPFPLNSDLIDEGKVLYMRYCSPCHGKSGKGDGAVGKKYTGVANLTGGQVALVNGGHIFHVITHGKGRMWPHASQVSPSDRWKIVEYVQVLQGQISSDGVKKGAEEEATDETAEKADPKKAEKATDEEATAEKADHAVEKAE